MAIKRATQPLGINFLPEERRRLKEIAQRDKRSEGEEVRWLVDAYTKGELMSADDFWKQFIRAKSAQVGGRNITSSVEGPESPDLPDSEAEKAAEDHTSGRNKNRLKK